MLDQVEDLWEQVLSNVAQLQVLLDRGAEHVVAQGKEEVGQGQGAFVWQIAKQNGYQDRVRPWLLLCDNEPALPCVKTG